MSANVTDAAAPLAPTKPSSRLLRGLLLIWLMLFEFFDHVLVDSYRDGRLRARAWPIGLRTIVALAICSYAIAVLSIVFSGPLRESLNMSVTVGSETLSFPRPMLWILLYFVVLSMALLQTAAVHVSAWLATAITALVFLILQFASVPDSSTLFSPGRIVTIVAGLALIVFTIIRRRFKFVWWEFPTILLIIGFSFAIASGRAISQSASTGMDFGPVMLSLTMATLGQLAIPAAIAAGVAVAELSASTALWAVGVVQRRLPGIAVIIGLVIVVIWRIWALYTVFADPEGATPLQLVSSAVLISVVAAFWYLLSRMRSEIRPLPSAPQLIERVAPTVMPIAVGFAISIAPLIVTLLIVQILFAYQVPREALVLPQTVVAVLSASTAVSIVRLLVGMALFVLAAVFARRGVRIIPELIGGIGVVTVSIAASSLAGWTGWLWTDDGLTVVATIGCFALLGWYGIRRQLTMSRVSGLAIALLLAAFFDQRDFVSDPLGALLGFTGVAFVLFGFVWSFLTGARGANTHSKKYPRPSRVLLFLANSLFGVTVLAFAALARNPNAGINLDGFADVGDRLFGTGLLVCALLALLASVVADRMPVIEEVK